VISGVEEIVTQNGDSRLMLAQAVSPQDVFYQLADQHVVLERFEIAVPSLDEIFIRVVEDGREAA
jgi:ABC-2 type transport system ATP-binding protein